jgi:hypothetical protein
LNSINTNETNGMIEKNLKFGKTILRLVMISKLINSQMIQDLFFKNSIKQKSIEDTLEEMLNNNIDFSHSTNISLNIS